MPNENTSVLEERLVTLGFIDPCMTPMKIQVQFTVSYKLVDTSDRDLLCGK
jgi:hypothetical protein